MGQFDKLEYTNLLAIKKKKEETLFGLLCFLENFFFHN